MQIHAEALAGESRPCAPEDCARCAGKQKLHKHRTYQRNANPTGEDTVTVACFLCRRSTCTSASSRRECSPTAAFQSRAWRHTSPPATGQPASEVERGCLERAEKKLLGRMTFLCGCLGRMLPVLDYNDLGSFWRALRMIGRLGEILLHLASEFKTSLLACYRSLKPRWERKDAPA